MIIDTCTYIIFLFTKICTSTVYTFFKFLSIRYFLSSAIYQHILSADATFVADVSHGSNMTYSWEYLNNVASTSASFVLTEDAAGTYEVKVTVKNDLNRVSQTVQLIIMEVVAGLAIECSTCHSAIYTPTRTNAGLSVSSTFGTQLTFTWSLSDSTSTYSTYHGESITHNYTSSGSYNVSVTATNDVSNSTVSTVIIVQDPVDGVSVTQSPSIVEINEQVTLFTAVTAGTDVAYSWDCSGVQMSSSISVMTTTFSSTGYHECRVIVSNKVSSVEEDKRIAVLTEISSLSINHLLTVNTTSNTSYAAKGTEYTFTAAPNDDFLVSYEWSIKVVQTGYVAHTAQSRDLIYDFPNDGLYEISLTATNNVSTKATTMTVESILSISSVTLRASWPHDTIEVGNSITYYASVVSGANKFYRWFLNGVEYTNQNSFLLLIDFPNPGVYTVRVEVSNKVSLESDEKTVTAYAPVSNATVYINNVDSVLAYVAQDTSALISCPYLTGSDIEYAWTITYTSLSIDTFDTSSVTYLFTDIGTYTISLHVSNPVSNEDGVINVEVQGSVIDLMIDISEDVVATGSSVTFSVVLNPGATNLVYNWYIAGDYFSSSNFTKQMTTAGVHNVSLTATNNVSSVTKQETIRVLDPIRNLRVFDCFLVREADSVISLTYAIDSGTNVSYSWIIEINSSNVTYSGQSISHLFPFEGVFNVFINAENEVSTGNYTCPLELHLPITPGSITLEVIDPNKNYIFQNQNVTFRATGDNLNYAHFLWNITGESSVNTSTNTYTHTFSTIGNHTLTLTISNGVSSVETSVSFEVQQFKCQIPRVTEVGDVNRTSVRSRAIELEVRVDALGCTEYLAVHSWTMYAINSCAADLNASHQVSKNSISNFKSPFHQFIV